MKTQPMILDCVQVVRLPAWSENNSLSLVLTTMPGTGCYPIQVYSDPACNGRT